MKINQAITPPGPKTAGNGAVRTAMPIPKVNTPVMGKDSSMLTNHQGYAR